MTDRWFRFYERTLDNPKAQRLPDRIFKGWVNLLCLAARNDGDIRPADVSFALRVSESVAQSLLTTLTSAALLDHDHDRDVYRPHDWSELQYASDSNAAERQKRYRERHKTVTRDAASDVTRDVTVTVQETETETEQNRKSPSLRSVEARGRRWGSDERVPEDWINEATEKRAERQLSPVNLAFEADRFANYWAAVAGSKARKTDWRKTWLNWATSDKVNGAPQLFARPEAKIIRVV